MYTTPQRLTVAGEAFKRLSVSKSILMPGRSWILSPLVRQSSLESSRVELRFSTQSGSTGPSSMIHFHPTGAHVGYDIPVKGIVETIDFLGDVARQSFRNIPTHIYKMPTKHIVHNNSLRSSMMKVL